MFHEGLDGKRLRDMVPNEVRWLHLLKKAFFDSDSVYLSDRRVDNAFREICIAVDVAATLQLSLKQDVAKWSLPPIQNNKKKFIQFLREEIPASSCQITLFDSRKNKQESYDLCDIVYAIRCMIHENENLNAAENPDFHVTLDWSPQDPRVLGRILGERKVVCNAEVIWWRVREVLAKFILGLDAMMAFERGVAWKICITPELKSIHPDDGRHL